MKTHFALSVDIQDTNRYVVLEGSKASANRPQYWEWSKYVSAPQESPIFNGDAYSMGGNGEFIPGHKGLVLEAPNNVNPTIYLDPGFGGGCVRTGPFANFTVNLGPVGLPNATAGALGGLAYNPRCLTRDVGPDPGQRWNNYTRVYGKGDLSLVYMMNSDA
jgi:tyrosinase